MKNGSKGFMKKVFKVFAGIAGGILALIAGLELLACWLWRN
jgi:hypothetical protein